MRDRGLLESAVHAAENVAAYAESFDLCDLAAAYIFHIAENQPFVDGNKRAALASGLVFLHQNGIAPNVISPPSQITCARVSRSPSMKLENSSPISWPTAFK